VFYTLLIKTERSQAISSIDRNDGSSARTASSRRLRTASSPRPSHAPAANALPRRHPRPRGCRSAAREAPAPPVRRSPTVGAVEWLGDVDRHLKGPTGGEVTAARS